MTVRSRPAAHRQAGCGTAGSRLDRRRAAMQACKTAAQAATAALAELDAQLDHNGIQTRDHEAALQAALDQVARLKKAIKAAGKEKTMLKAARKDARRGAARVKQRAAAAEARYDRAVLAELVRREKDHDLSAHPPAGTADDTADDTARATAARATATRAHPPTSPDTGPGHRAPA